MKTYPEGQVTPYAAMEVLKGEQPMWAYRSYNDEVVFHIDGPLAPIPGPTLQEGVLVKSTKGLVPPFTTIDQQGAVEDGVTFVDALYEPLEADFTLEVHGRTPQGCRRVIRDWIASNDVKKPGELSCTTQEYGRWWAPVRWFKTPTDQLDRATSCKQTFTWTWRVDNAFWRSYDDVDSFRFTYEDMTDTFTVDDATDLGVNWPQLYDGDGGGYNYVANGQARWKDDPDDLFLTLSRSVVNGPYKDFETGSDNQVINMVLGSMSEFSFPSGAYNDLWGRMGRNPDGTWDGNGIRLRWGWFSLRLSAFADFVEVWHRETISLLPPFPGEKFSLVCGYEGNPRKFVAMRNNAEVFWVQESGTQSLIGAAYRGIGFGMEAGGSLVTQATPANVRKISSGDNTTVSQSGFLRRVNAGDQTMFDKLTFYGPGTFRVGNGPGTTDYVEFGPLLPNQVMWINTDPRRPRIRDLTSVPPTQQELDDFQEALKGLIDFATGNNVPPLLQQLESVFGINPPQGNPYSLFKGRFTQGIPPREPGKDLQAHNVFVAIDNGNASSKVIAAGTPLRRFPH